jgi:alcohol dehydrogenase class IV
MEVVGAGRPLAHPALPVIAVPTTAGAGSEATRNAVVIAPERRVKASIRHDSLMPRLALVDPQLTFDLPPDVTAACGMDALTQLIEPLVGRRANPLAEALCLQALPGLGEHLRRAVRHPQDAAARTALSNAALVSGIALANAGLGAVHGIAAAVGGAFPAPHGVVCATLLPHVTAANLAALQRAGDAHRLNAYRRVARALTGDAGASEDRLVELVRELASDLAIPGLTSYGMTSNDIPALAEAAAQSSSTRNNPAELSVAELEACIRAAL